MTTALIIATVASFVLSGVCFWKYNQKKKEEKEKKGFIVIATGLLLIFFFPGSLLFLLGLAILGFLFFG